MLSVSQGKPVVPVSPKRHLFCPPLNVKVAVVVVSMFFLGGFRIAHAAVKDTNSEEKAKRAWSGKTMDEETIARQKRFYAPSMRNGPTLLDWVEKRDILAPLIPDHEYNPTTGKMFRSDGDPLDVPAALWNARMDYSLSHRQPSTPPSVYDQLMVGEFNVPLLKGFLFNEKTGVLYRQDGRKINPDGTETDRKAWFWNAKICYFAPTKPGGPTILDWIVSGDVVPAPYAGHSFNPQTGKIIRTAGRPLDIGAELWNARVEYSVSHRQPSNPPTPFDLFATYTGSSPPAVSGCHVDEKTGKLYRTDGKPLDNRSALWNARLDYRPVQIGEGQEASLYDKLMTGEEELPSIPGHRLDVRTGHLIPEDGGSPSLEAARWNARIDQSAKEHTKTATPTLLDRVLSGDVNPPSIPGYEFEPSTGHLILKKGREFDILAEVWNARVDYSAAHREPSDPPTRYDQVMTGELTPPSIAHHHFDAKTGLLYRTDNGSLGMSATLWNMRMESDRNDQKPSSTPTKYDKFRSGELIPPSIAGHTIDPKTGLLYRTDGRKLDPGAEFWNRSMREAFWESTAQIPVNAEMAPALNALVDALDALEGKTPTSEQLSQIGAAWKRLPEPAKGELREDVIYMSCAGLLAIGDMKSFGNARSAIPDMDAFREEIMGPCPECDGSGLVKSRCTSCGGSGRCGRCGGRGKIGVPHLAGARVPPPVVCGSCSGSGHCANCNEGMKEIRHAPCNGTGRMVTSKRCLAAFESHRAKAKENAFPLLQKARGLVFRDGEWISPAEVAERKRLAEEKRKQEEEQRAEEKRLAEDAGSETATALQLFKEGLDALRGENGQERDVAKAYRRFKQADEKGYVLGKVGVAHLSWTMTDDDRQKTDIPPLQYYIIDLKYAAVVGKSAIAKCEFGLIQLQRQVNPKEGLKMIKEAAEEGSETAAMFLEQVAMQKARSSLSYETILGLFAKNSEAMSLFQQACEVELEKEYLLSLERQSTAP